jgi:hypothetical protein
MAVPISYSSRSKMGKRQEAAFSVGEEVGKTLKIIRWII